MGEVATYPTTVVWDSEESFKTGSQAKREKMALYVEWLLTPPTEREPKTKKALAEQMGVSVQTLHNYNKEAWLQRELGERARAIARVDRLPEILESLYRITIGVNADGTEKRNRFGEVVFPSPGASVTAANTLLQWMSATKDLRESPLNAEEMTSEELVKVALEVLQRVNEKGE